MYEICRFLASTAPKKVAKARKPAAKSCRVGATAILSVDGKTYTITERDTRYKSAWFIADANGNRVPYSFANYMLKVL